MCVHDMFFLKLHVSAHQVVPCRKFFSGSGRVHELLLCLQDIFFKINFQLEFYFRNPVH